MSDPHATPAPAVEDPRIETGHEEHPHVNYMLVFGALIAFTVISYLADVLGAKMGAEPGTKLKVFVGLIVLVVASFKAAAVMLYFMHLKFEKLWKYALLAPTIVLALALIVSLMPDMAGDYYARVIPQTEAAAAMHQAEAEDHKHAATHPQKDAPAAKAHPQEEKPAPKPEKKKAEAKPEPEKKPASEKAAPAAETEK